MTLGGTLQDEPGLVLSGLQVRERPSGKDRVAPGLQGSGLEPTSEESVCLQAGEGAKSWRSF